MELVRQVTQEKRLEIECGSVTFEMMKECDVSEHDTIIYWDDEQDYTRKGIGSVTRDVEGLKEGYIIVSLH